MGSWINGEHHLQLQVDTVKTEAKEDQAKAEGPHLTWMQYPK